MVLWLVVCFVFLFCVWSVEMSIIFEPVLCLLGIQPFIFYSFYSMFGAEVY